MKKLKRMLSGFLALALVLSVLLNSGVVASAEETETLENAPTEAETLEEEGEPTLAEDTEEESAEEGTLEESTKAETAEETTTENEAVEDLAEETALAGNTEAEFIERIAESSEMLTIENNAESVTNSEAAGEIAADEETDLDSGINVTSMYPLTEVNAYLDINVALMSLGYSMGEIQSMTPEEKSVKLTIDEVLANIKDTKGNKIIIDKSATTAWRYLLNEADHVETYQTYSIGSGETFDFQIPENATSFQMELIVGSDGQLNSENTRYIIKVYSLYNESLDFGIYAYYNGVGNVKTEPSHSDFSIIEESGFVDNDGKSIPCWSYGYAYDEVISCDKVMLNMKSTLASEHPDITVDIYVKDQYQVNSMLLSPE